MKVNDFQKLKNSKKKISMLTVYDYSFAKIIEESNVHSVLIGDSAAMVMHGYENTIYADIKMICAHVKSVSKAIKKKFIVADMPFMTNRLSLTKSSKNAEKLMQAGAHAVKIESADGNLKLIRHLVESGIPVMGHLGLTPQFVHSFGGWKVQGKQNAAKDKILKDASLLQEAGCFSIVLECVPSSLAREISSSLKIPTIGIGAGPDVDGQILVLQDLLGMNSKFKPKFVRNYLDGEKLILDAINTYSKDIELQNFPSIEESFE